MLTPSHGLWSAVEDRGVSRVLTLILSMCSKSYFAWQNLSLILSASPLWGCLPSGKRGFLKSRGFWLCGFSEITVVRASMQTRNGRKCLWGTCCLETSDFKKGVLHEYPFVKMRKWVTVVVWIYLFLDLKDFWHYDYFNFGIYCQQRKDIDEKLHWAK